MSTVGGAAREPRGYFPTLLSGQSSLAATPGDGLAQTSDELLDVGHPDNDNMVPSARNPTIISLTVRTTSHPS